MGHQIIKQPDGLLAIWSTGTDSWILYDATPDELAQYYADRAAKDARRSALETIEHILLDRPDRAYYQFTKTFAEAQADHLEAGQDPAPFAFLDRRWETVYARSILLDNGMVKVEVEGLAGEDRHRAGLAFVYDPTEEYAFLRGMRVIVHALDRGGLL